MIVTKRGTVQVVRINSMKFGCLGGRFGFGFRGSLRIFLGLLSEKVILGARLFPHLIEFDAAE